MPKNCPSIKPETALKYAIELKRHCITREFCDECPFYDAEKVDDARPFAFYCKLQEFPCDWRL